MSTYIKQKLPALAGILLVSLAMWAGCKKPSPFGAELLTDEFADIAYTDTIGLRCTIEREDSSLTSDRGSTAEYFLCGELTDPQFGKSSSDIYALMLGQTLNPNFNTLTQAFDSIVLYLRYDVKGFYGDTLGAMQTLRVLRVDPGSSLVYNQDYYSNQSLPATEELGRVENFLPKPQAKDTLFDGIKGPYLRVVLKQEFGQEIFNTDSAYFSVDSLFFKKLRGLKITSSTGSTPGAMMAFDLNDNSLSRMRLYYHEIVDSTAKKFDFYFKGANKFTHFTHDHQYNGAPAGASIGQEYADEKIYTQGMEGLRVKIEFPYANKLDRIAVNQALLVLTVADETPNLLPASQLLLTEMNEDSTFSITSDVSFSFGTNLTGGFGNFGGSPKKEVVNGTTVTRYRLTMSEIFQHMVDDDSSANTKKRTVYLGVYPRSRTAERAIFYGPKSLNFPAKLELTYTNAK